MEDQLLRYLQAGAWLAYWDRPEELPLPAQLGRLDASGRCTLRIPGTVSPWGATSLRLSTPRWEVSIKLNLLTMYPDGSDTVLGASLNDWDGIQSTLRSRIAEGDVRRQHPRAVTPPGEVRWVRIRREGSETWSEAELLDLSAGGLRVRAPARLAQFLTVGAAMRVQTRPRQGLPGETLRARLRHIAQPQATSLAEAILGLQAEEGHNPLVSLMVPPEAAG